MQASKAREALGEAEEARRSAESATRNGRLEAASQLEGIVKSATESAHKLEKQIKRAGMDYWKDLDVTTYVNYQEFLEKNPGAKIYMATTKSPNLYTDVKYEPDCYIMFGKESAGIPEEILCHHKEDSIRIPMIGDIRSLNLGNSVAIVLYEALRQNGFAGMNTEGHLHRLEWDE